LKHYKKKKSLWRRKRKEREKREERREEREERTIPSNRSIGLERDEEREREREEEVEVDNVHPSIHPHLSLC